MGGRELVSPLEALPIAQLRLRTTFTSPLVFASSVTVLNQLGTKTDKDFTVSLANSCSLQAHDFF